MFQSIAVYDAKRKQKAPRRQAVPREHMVYFARMGDSRIIKIGRTRNIAARLHGHVAESGMTPRYLAQLVVRTAEDSLALERHVLAFAKSRFPRDENRREWFSMSDHDVAEALFAIHDTSPVEIISQRGDPAAPDEEATAFDAARHEASSAASARNRMRRH